MMIFVNDCYTDFWNIWPVYNSSISAVNRPDFQMDHVAQDSHQSLFGCRLQIVFWDPTFLAVVGAFLQFYYHGCFFLRIHQGTDMIVYQRLVFPLAQQSIFTWREIKQPLSNYPEENG